MITRIGRRWQAAFSGRVAQSSPPAGSSGVPARSFEPAAGTATLRAAQGLVAVGAMVAALLSSGCVNPEVKGGDVAAVNTEPSPEKAPKDSGPRFEVASSVEGKVVSVRKDLRYVIVDFSFSRLPEPGATMAVMRDGERVGKVRITTRASQARGGAVVADIKEGEARAGDLVSGDL